MARNIVPTQDLGESLGTSSKRWKELFAETVTLTTLTDGVDTIDLNDLLNGVGFKTWTMTLANPASAPTTNNTYMRSAGGSFTNTNPVLVPITGKIKVIAGSRTSGPAASWDVEIRQMPAETVIATLSLGAPDDTKVDATFNAQVNAGDLLGIFINGNVNLARVTVLVFED